MTSEIIKYYLQLPHDFHFAAVPELSTDIETVFHMIPDYGVGSARCIRFEKDWLLIMIVDFTPNSSLEKVTSVNENYLELSFFETDTNSFKIGSKKVQRINKGLHYYLNTAKTTYTYYKAGQRCRFIKIILTKDYYDTCIKDRYKDIFKAEELDDMLHNTNSFAINFLFQQIRAYQAEGRIQQLFLEAKVMELLSLLHNQTKNRTGHLPVSLDKNDIRGLKKTVALMEKDLSAYPAGELLAKTANMSHTRFHLAFRKYYGSTPYEYLKKMRLNAALLLLENSDYEIGTVSAMVGYHNSGHFAKLFKTSYGVTPKRYRQIHRIR